MDTTSTGGTPRWAAGSTAATLIAHAVVRALHETGARVLVADIDTEGCTAIADALGVSVTIYLTDVEDYQRNGREIGRIWRELVGPWYPAMAGIGVVRLWQPEALIEITGAAVLPG